MVKPNNIVTAKDIQVELNVSQSKAKVMLIEARKFYKIEPRKSITFAQVLKAHNLEA